MPAEQPLARSHTVGTVLAAHWALFGGVALAQLEPSEPDGVGLADPSVEDVAEALDATDLTPPAIAPTRDATWEPVRPGTGVTPGSLAEMSAREALRRAKPLRERTFLVKERATLLRAGTGEWVAAFHAGVDEQGRERKLPAMVLLPSPTLEGLETTAEGRGLDVAYRLSGEVTRYHGRNYLMPTAFGVEAIAPAQPEIIDLNAEAPNDIDSIENTAQSNNQTDAPAPNDLIAVGADLDDPSVADLIQDLEARRSVARGLARPREVTEPTQDLELASGVLPAPARNGELLVRRKGRLTRLGGGEWAFVVDQDADRSNPALAETPIVLLPCRALMRMEHAVRDAGDAVTFELTGKLSTYAGRVYVMPTLAVRMPEREGLAAVQ
ncbi:MAG: hypothetical protein AAGK04_01010 [Planctomycetota bacterium]